MKIKENLEALIVNYNKVLTFVNHKKEGLELLEVEGIVPNNNSFGLDFDNLKREQVLLVIKVLALGKWNKSPNYNGKSLDYSHTTEDGVFIRLYAAQPPQSCQLIEEEYEEPAQPAQMKKRFKIVCKSENEDAL